MIVVVAIALYAYSKSRKPKTDSSAVAQSPKDDDEGNGSGNKNIAPNNTYSQTQQPQTLQQTPAQSATYTTPPPLPIQQEETEQLSWKGEKLRETIQIFQQKGAISPQTALTAKELGLSRMFVRIMEKRKGQTKIFIQINGKYYLNQKALEENKQ